MKRIWIFAIIAVEATLFVFSCLGDTADLQTNKGGAVEIPNASKISWKWAGWGGGGWFWSCVVDPSNSDIFYLAGDVGGVYKSVDRGVSWTIVNRGISNYGVYSMALAKSRPQTVFAMTLDGICKSIDGAASWTALESTRKGRLNLSSVRNVSVHSIAVDPVNADIVYAGNGSGNLYKSVNGGNTWSQLPVMDSNGPAGVSQANSAPITSISIAEDDPHTLFVSTLGKGLFKSLDAGANWHALATPSQQAFCVKSAPSDKEIVYACFQGALMKSTDGGATWSSLNCGIPADYSPRDIVIDARNPKNIVCTAIGSYHGMICKSENGGASWERFEKFKRDYQGAPTMPQGTPAGGVPKNDDEVGIDAKGYGYMCELANIAASDDFKNILVAGDWSNIISRDGGATWEETSKGADISVIEDLCFCRNSVYAVVMDQGLFRSDDSGATWKQLFPLKLDFDVCGDQYRVFAEEKNGATKILSTFTPWINKPNCVFISEDGGKSFEIIKAGLPDYVTTINCMYKRGRPRGLAVDPVDTNVIYLGMEGDPEPGKSGGGIFKSTDGGKTWNQLAAQPGSRRILQGLVIDPANHNRIYWGASGPTAGVYKSEDGGESWTKTALGEQVYNLAVTPDGSLFAEGLGVWKSLDNGATWKNCHCPSKGFFLGMTVDPSKASRIFVSTTADWDSEAEGGIYMSEDGGESWKDITGDIPFKKPDVLRYDVKTGELWAACVGIYRLKI